MDRAPSYLPFRARYLGLSGMTNARMRNKAAGNAVAQNIQRQPASVFHWGVWVPAILQFTIWAASIPITMVSWLRVTSLPRMDAGAASAMYIGLRPEAIPIAIPPTKRAARKPPKLLNAPVPIEDTTNIKAARTIKGLRP